MHEFDRIYADYFAEVYKFILRLCHDPGVAEEITQEAFFKALKHIDSYDSSYKLSTWLCQIAKNTYYTYAKRQNRQVDVPLEYQLSDEDIEARFADRETAFAIHRALHRLQEPYKEVFWLRTFGDLSYAQIGVLFAKTESWARVTYYRAKLQIKEELE